MVFFGIFWRFDACEKSPNETKLVLRGVAEDKKNIQFERLKEPSRTLDAALDS